jgi:hypothetical protein
MLLDFTNANASITPSTDAYFSYTVTTSLSLIKFDLSRGAIMKEVVSKIPDCDDYHWKKNANAGYNFTLVNSFLKTGMEILSIIIRLNVL